MLWCSTYDHGGTVRSFKDLQRLSLTLRKKVLEIIYTAGGGHTGGSLSSLDILIALYFHTLRYDPRDPEWPDRDRFVLSKGHSVEGLYCVLAEAGFFPREELGTYGKFNTRLFGHPTMKVPGVEVPTGALGHGLSVGVGMAIAGKRGGDAFRVYVLMGDGEQAEGSIWEAGMAAAHYRLDNIVGIIDYNGLQISGDVDQVMRVSSLKERWTSFGWRVHEGPGNDPVQLADIFDRLPRETGAPSLLIAHTVKGKGVSFMEGDPSWHHRVPTPDEYERALRELSECLEGIGS
jgi:transketolase